MKRIGILTAGGDTPALNATIFGAVQRANALKIEMVGLIRGYAALLDPQTPHVFLNPLFSGIPELDPCKGGTLLGSSRTYVDSTRPENRDAVARSLRDLKLDGLICIGGDGTINGMQPLTELLPCVLAPKTIDNDLGLNYPGEPEEWAEREAASQQGSSTASTSIARDTIRLEEMINYATPGYATAVFTVAQSIERLRTTAESHHRIAIVEVMGRQSGYIALGAAYAQPDLILIPEVPVNPRKLTQQVARIYDRQHNVVIVVGEGVRNEEGTELGATSKSFDPAGNIRYSGAADAIAQILKQSLGDDLFEETRRFEPDSSPLFSRKIGHTQRGGRPILFDRYSATQLGGKAVDLLTTGSNNEVATLQYSETAGFTVSSIAANKLRDRNGEIRPREVHPSFFDSQRLQLSPLGVQYLRPIFSSSVGADDVEYIRREVFDDGCLNGAYQSITTDIRKRIRRL